MLNRLVVTGALCLGFCLPLLRGQNPVDFQLGSAEEQVSAGDEFVAVLTAVIEPGWHLYAMTKYPTGKIAPQPTTVEVSDNPVFSLAAPVLQQTPHVAYDPNFDIDTEYFDGITDFEIPIQVAADAGPGIHTLPVQIRYMACNDRMCLPPRRLNVSTEIQVVSAAGVTGVTSPAEPAPTVPEGVVGEGVGAQVVEPEPGRAGPSIPEESRQPPEAEESIPSTTLAYIWFAMAMGGLALLTPCVFPMIPITVSYFTKREVSRKRALGEAALYSLGIILTFTLLGFLLTFLFGAGGLNRVATSPLVNVLIAAVFIVFALSLFGVFEIRVPSRWLSAVDKKSSSVGGPIGILLMALTFSLTSFTCTVPFVGTVMVAATQGDWLWSLIGISAFAAVFSAPFFLLALFPSWLKSLPKSGSWMDSVKITMGFLELAAALKFVSNVDLVYQWELITRPVFITVWLALALVTALYLLGKFRFPHEAPVASISAGRVLSATLFLAISLYLLRGLFGFPLGELDAFLPPRDYGGVAAFGLASQGMEATSEEFWFSDYQQALQAAREEQKPMFIDFTGYTCTNCRWMEANVFVREEVRRLFDRFVLVRLYTDGGEPEHEENMALEQERFGTIALPFYALMTPRDEVIATFPGLTRDVGEFVEFLEKGLNAPARESSQ